jgi:7-cyano-7-deazaguanine synthase
MVKRMEKNRCAVLVSGGLDSAVLLAELSATSSAVFPIFIQAGLRWEAAELYYLRGFLEAIARPAIQPLQLLKMPVTDLYGNHWSISGQDIPDAASPDEAVFLPGRNVLLLAKAMLWCHLNNVPAVALAVLSANPFPDATPAFFNAYADAVNQAVQGHVQILRPFAALKKIDVLRRGRELPLGLTFSCIQPCKTSEVSKTSEVWIHCGKCNKCGERGRAFRDAGIPDPTSYASESPCIA